MEIGAVMRKSLREQTRILRKDVETISFILGALVVMCLLSNFDMLKWSTSYLWIPVLEVMVFAASVMLYQTEKKLKRLSDTIDGQVSCD